MNALTLENLKIGDIHGYEKNAKMHSERQVQQIIASINQFGFNNPILIDENNEIIAGPWWPDFKKELLSFPGSIFKDQCDAFSQGVIYIDNQYISGKRGMF